tara:strand:- start:5954 stop:6472 length:519 start_codon:yes stop_codon:yes gene_type:complete
MKGPRIKLGEEGDHLRKAHDALLHALVLESDARLKLATPVDTGRLRNAWTISQNRPATHGVGETPEGMQPTGDKQRPRLITDSSSAAVRLSRTPQRYEGYGRGQEKAGNNYHITNNMVYAEPVMFGTGLPRSWGGQYRTKQNAVPGFPVAIAKGLNDWAKTQWSNLGNSGKF